MRQATALSVGVILLLCPPVGADEVSRAVETTHQVVRDLEEIKQTTAGHDDDLKVIREAVTETRKTVRGRVYYVRVYRAHYYHRPRCATSFLQGFLLRMPLLGTPAPRCR